LEVSGGAEIGARRSKPPNYQTKDSRRFPLQKDEQKP
jgi:hypothetical protein